MIYGAGITFDLIKDIESRRHFHPEAELIFLIEGKVRAELKNAAAHMEKEDILMINAGELHALYASADAVAVLVHFSGGSFGEEKGSGLRQFFCDSSIDKRRSYKDLRDILHELVYQYVYNTHRTECLKMSLLYKLADCLAENYTVQEDRKNPDTKKQDVRLREIIQYVDENYRDSVSLSELAERLFVSASTLSRAFKKETGIYFADYVNQVRMNSAVGQLLYTDNHITKIAVDSGFSNPSVFNRVFREIYEMPPSDFRKKKQELFHREMERKQAVVEKLKTELRVKGNFKKAEDTKKTAVFIDVREGKPYEKTWNKAINIGSVYNMTLANLQYHTLYLTEQLGFKYVRLWNVFSEKLMLCDGQTIGNYNYDKIDGVLDFLISHHIYPFLDFGKRPDAAVKSESEVVFYKEEYIPFCSRNCWEALVLDFVQHVIRRYGRGEVSNWIFELSCDRIHAGQSHCYRDDDYDYFNAFLFLYNTVKRLVPEAQVGGPSAITNWDRDFFMSFLWKCRKNQIEPDFISVMLFTYETKYENGAFIRRRVIDDHFEREQIDAVREMMANSGINSRLFIAEWNSTLSNRNYLNDSCFRAAYIAGKLSQLWGRADLTALWIGSDWVSSYFDTVGIANGGSGLLTKDSIRKPAYFVLQFLNRLGNTLLSSGENYIAATDEKQGFYVLCFNYKKYGSSYFVHEENMRNPERINDVFEDSEPVCLEIVLNGVREDTQYVIKRRTISPDGGSILNEWKKFQYDKNMNGSDVKYLREICFPRMSMERAVSRGTGLKFSAVLKPHETSLFHIYEDEFV